MKTAYNTCAQCDGQGGRIEPEGWVNCGGCGGSGSIVVIVSQETSPTESFDYYEGDKYHE